MTTTLLQALSQKLNNACEAPQLVRFFTEAEACLRRGDWWYEFSLFSGILLCT